MSILANFESNAGQTGAFDFAIRKQLNLPDLMRTGLAINKRGPGHPAGERSFAVYRGFRHCKRAASGTRQIVFCCFLFLNLSNFAEGQQKLLDPSMHLLRTGETPEWDEFKNGAAKKELTLKFAGRENAGEQTLQLRQYEVKHDWQVLLNGKKLGMLATDVNDMIVYFKVPEKSITGGENILQVMTVSKTAEDILVGEIVLHDKPLEALLNESVISLSVTEKKAGKPVPCRVTIINEKRVMQSVSVEPAKELATRPGTVYSLNGTMTIGLPAGRYTIYAGRGFEYGIDSFEITLKRGDRKHRKMVITREVNTSGWISSDPHVHTVTYSGHGDATIQERVLTIAGEGIELPVMTDHNVKVDLRPLADSFGAGRYFKPVTGTEFTTNLGHFNIFQVSQETAIPDPTLKDWNHIPGSLDPDKKNVVILNHARDIHKGFRPFDPTHHISSAGMGLTGWSFPANAMEIINSGSLQSDNLQLFHDWTGMLNRGEKLTPVGSSDSHDVSRYILGQARTYIQVRDDEPGTINVEEAIRNFIEGKVSVSMGLFTGITIDGNVVAGNLAESKTETVVTVTVQGPAWSRANRVSLFANGNRIREAKFAASNKPGVKFKHSWKLPKFKQDVFLVAIAEGPYHHLPYWPLVKPFQPVSSNWTGMFIGISGAAWIDGDGDGKRTAAFGYATNLWERSNGDVSVFIRQLDEYDEATAIQGASILASNNISFDDTITRKALSLASPAVKRGFEKFISEWKLAKRTVR